jgi:hypothetical protein
MKPIFKISHETEKLIEYFRALPIGAEVSFANISKAVGFEVGSSTPAYNSARRIVQRDHSIVIEGIRGFGCMRVNGTEIVQSADRFFKRVRRGSRREAHKQEIAVMSNLERDEMLKASENLSRLRILESTAVSPKRAASNRPVVEVPPVVEAMARRVAG